MPKIIPNKPQHLLDLQFKLKISPLSIADELRVRSGAVVNSLSAKEISGPFKLFIFPESSPGEFNIDFGEAPVDLDSFDMLVDSGLTSIRSWSLEALNVQEFWQSDGIEIASGSTCLMLSFSKSTDGRWTVTDRSVFEGEDASGEENSSLPDGLRSLAASATARGLGKNAAHFLILIDDTPSMDDILDTEIVPRLVSVIRSISASKNTKPIFLSLGGFKNELVGVLDSAEESYSNLRAQSKSDKDRFGIPPFSQTLEKMVYTSAPNSALYVLTDSLPWIDEEELSRELLENDKYIYVVLTGSGLGVQLNNLDDRVLVVDVSAALGDDPKELIKRFV
jgi:hypothetical protein